MLVQSEAPTLSEFFRQIRACRHCEDVLPLGARPIIQGSETSRIMIVGQAPSAKGHASGLPWNDASGKLLRQWLDIDTETFYDPQLIAIASMGFCYPGTSPSGDLPPRPECAALWRTALHAHLPHLKLILLIGSYAQRYYLRERAKKSVTETVLSYQEYGPLYFPLVHPSPRNKIWHKRNPWFEAEMVPVLRERVTPLLV